MARSLHHRIGPPIFVTYKTEPGLHSHAHRCRKSRRLRHNHPKPDPLQVFPYTPRMPRKSQTPKSAQHTMMDILSRREHSEWELKHKLMLRNFSEEEISNAIEKAKSSQWLGQPEEAAQQLADQLHRKNKGIEFINSTLAEKGLPSVSRDEALELEKAEALVKTKYSGFSEYTRDEKIKVARFLTSRGFDSSTIRKVLKNEEEF